MPELTRQYAFAASLAAIGLLLNTVLPIFALAGDRLILLASVLTFAASLVWMKDQPQRVFASISAIG